MQNETREIKVILPSKEKEQERIRVAAYCRVSTDSDDQINSFYAQMKYYTDYIRMHKEMELVDIYADEGITGTVIQKRDEFKRLLKDCKNRKIDRVLVKSVQRFARNSLECIEAVRELKSCGTTVFFENDNIDTERLNNEMILYIKSAFAENESISASKRMSTSIRMRMESGNYVHTIAPFGYRLGKDGLEIIPEEAETVREIFNMYLAGAGMTAIVKHLWANDKSGVAWNKSHIGYILDNERYIGDCLLHKYYTPAVFPLHTKPNRGQQAKYYCEGTHEAIISKEVFEKVQELRKKRKPQIKRRGQDSLFTGKLYCRNCGWAYKRIYRKGELYWACSRKGYTKEVCRAKAYSDKELRQAFVDMFNKLKQNEKTVLDETITLLQNLKVLVSRTNPDLGEIDKELADLCEQNSAYGEMYASGIIHEDIFYEKTDKIKKRISTLRMRRTKLISEDEEEVCIENLRRLKRIIDGADKMLSADEKLFDKTVEKIHAEQDGSLSFVLLGELTLKIGVK